METRAALLARTLAQSGHCRVSMVVGNFGQPWNIHFENIEFSIYQPLLRPAIENVSRFYKRKWFPVLHLDHRDILLFWHLPLAILYRLLPAWIGTAFWRRRRPDIVCCFGNNSASAQVIADCTRLGIPTVLSIASDDDLSPNYQPSNKCLNDYNTPNWMAHYALENAEHIFVQTESQLRDLESRFGRTGKIIRNPVAIATDSPLHWPTRSERDTVLWIGRSDTFHKRPLLFLDLARRCPDLTFVMIVNRTDANVFDTLLCDRPDNLTIIEQVPHSEIWNYYQRARVFVSTSAYEGFPNTFLQCAVAGVPVASLEVDPDGILVGRDCGLLANGSMERLTDNIRKLWTDQELAESYARTFHHFALENHSLDSQVARFDTLLCQAIDTPLRYPPIPWWKAPFQRFVRRRGVS